MGHDAAMRAVERALVPLVEPLADVRLSKSLERYMLDPFAHLDDGHVRILDLETQAAVPFKPTDAQREMLEAWFDLHHLRESAKTGEPELLFRNVHEEKSRQEGATTILAYGFLWVVQYHPARGLVVHVNGDEVDDGGQASTYDSIFGKIRYMAEHGVVGPPDGIDTFWPEHLRPGRYLSWRARPSMIRNRLRPTSYIRGAVQSPDVGRGRKYTHGLLDEAARLAWGESVQAAITRSIPTGRFYNSTPNGKANVYYRIRETRPKNFIFLRHHWSGHPIYSKGLHVAGDQPDRCPLCAGTARGEKWTPENPVAHRYPGKLTSPWFEEAILELTDAQVAQELEIDYEGSLTARVYPEFSEERHVVESIPYEPNVPLEFGIDYGWGASATWINIYQRVPGELRQIGEVVVMQGVPETVIAELVEVLADLGVTLTELEPRFMSQLRAIGDPAADSALATGGSLADEYRKQGFNPSAAPSGPGSVVTSITAVKRLLGLSQPVRFLISKEACPQTIRAFEQNRWPTDRTGAIKENADAPLNDVFNDGMRATAYYCVETFPPPTVEEVLGGATAGISGGGNLEDMRDHGGSGRLDGGLSGDMKF